MKQELERVNSSTHEARKEAFFMSLEASIPEWREINDSPIFHTWLRDEDPITGVTRQSALSGAEASLDARRVIKIFNTFQQAHSRPEPTAPSKLARQVQPETVEHAPVISENVVRFTRDQVKKFYEDVRRGVYNGRTTERLSMERKIDLAAAKGAISD
jgi:hypothetical protein